MTFFPLIFFIIFLFCVERTTAPYFPFIDYPPLQWAWFMRWRRKHWNLKLDISPAVGSIGCCYFLLGLNKLISVAILQPCCLYMIGPWHWSYVRLIFGLPHVLVQPEHVDCVGYKFISLKRNSLNYFYIFLLKMNFYQFTIRYHFFIIFSRTAYYKTNHIFILKIKKFKKIIIFNVVCAKCIGVMKQYQSCYAFLF